MSRKGVWSDNFHYQRSRRSQRTVLIYRAVLDASHQLVAEVGPRGFTVVEAARRANVGRTTVYKYFRDKATLLAACRADLARRESRNIHLSARAARARAQYGRGPGRLRPAVEAVRQAVLTLAQHLEAHGDLFLIAAAEGIRGRRRPTPGLLAPLPPGFFQAMTELLQEAQRAGQVRACLEPERVATWVSALWWHHFCLRGPQRDGAPSAADRLSADIGMLLTALGAA